VIEQLQNHRCVLVLNQTTEAWPIDHNQICSVLSAKNIPLSKVIFATSNLNETGDIVVATPFFGTLQHSSISVKSHINYKTAHSVKTFSCLNRVIRDHRRALMLMFEHYQLFNFGEVSHDAFSDCILVNFKDHPSFTQHTMDLLSRRLPLVLDQSNFNINHAPTFFNETYLRTWVSVVTETFYNEYPTAMFFSEKIFKPINASHPFILVGAPFSLRKLKELGFKTFDWWWDESYDDILDPVDRLESICKLIAELTTWTREQWFETYHEMESIIVYNLEHLKTTQWNKKFETVLQSKLISI
jgi:hypothetical protein